MKEKELEIREGDLVKFQFLGRTEYGIIIVYGYKPYVYTPMGVHVIDSKLIDILSIKRFSSPVELKWFASTISDGERINVYDAASQVWKADAKEETKL